MATYQQNMYTGAAEGYVQYEIAPEFGTPVAPGETVTISAKAFCRDAATGSISVDLQAGSGSRKMVFANCSIAKRRAGWFSITFQMPEFSDISARTAKLSMTFTLWEGTNGTGGGSGTVAVSGQEITYLTHRFDPMVLEMDFGRCDAAGNWDNVEGQYLRCGALKLSKNAKAALSELTTAKITCTDESGAVVKTVNLDAAKHLTPAFSGAGYSEAAPGIFEGFVTQLGMNYTLSLTLADPYNQTAATVRVVRCFARLHLSGARNGGVGVGMFSTATDKVPKFEVSETHESFFHGGIYGVSNYQEGEVATGGHWIDGKPIYRYSFSISALLVGNGSTSILTLPSTIGHVINYSLWRSGDLGTGTGIPIPGTASDVRAMIGFQIVNNVLSVWSGTWHGTITQTVTGFIEYTKADTTADPGAPEGPGLIDYSDYPDEAIARTDYLAMMMGIEIPEEASAGDVQADAAGTESPGIAGEAPRSENCDKVARYYKYGVWNAQMVRNAVGRWITDAEAKEILDDDQTEGE